MKSLISTLTLTLSVLFLFAQKNDTFKISYKFSIPDSILNIDPDTETDPVKKELATTAMLALMFQDGDKPIAQAWVNKDFIRVTNSLMSDSYQITNKNTQESFNIFPSEQQYSVTAASTDKLISIGEEYYGASELPIEYVENTTKDILGYKCKLAKINIVDGESQNISLELWYTEDIPKLYWGEYAYLEALPGAALQITTMGIGIAASEIIKDNNKTIFAIPENYTLVEELDEEALSEVYPYEVAEDRYAYLDTISGLYGIMDTEENIIVEPSYTLINTYYNGHAIVANEEFKYGTIDLNGKTLFPLTYSSLDYDDETDMYLFSKDELYGLMDKDGKTTIPNTYQGLSFFRDGYAIFYKDGKEGLIDNKEQIVVPAAHASISTIVNNHFITVENDIEYCLYDLKTNKKLFGGFEYLTVSGEPNLLIAIKNEKYGFIDFTGKAVIPFKYHYVSTFQDGIANIIDSDNNEYYINTKGEKVEQ